MSAPTRSTRRSRPGRGGSKAPDQQTAKTSDQKLDEALALTFPASDPPAQTQPIVHVGTQDDQR